MIEMPRGWVSSPKSLPDMSTRQDSASWVAVNGEYSLRVRWQIDIAQYVCEAVVRTSVVETRFLVYPHELVEWLVLWFPRAA